ncbi:methyltransferase domain-containing protein [Flexibacterium corallicola]|uniref:methyltransferase domain-containing protein n=1 Tax=Flexibacterium corallicola TaxID=3037259 RepID=UPI00286F0A1A|nr:methyltransferase domain-containing protein [Pseudovibrio sp. M1P-2-3]
MADINDEVLAEAYNRALSLEKQGKLEEAAQAYAQVLELDPEDHGGAAIRLASMGLGSTPAKAPDAYVSTLFDQHAEVFDSILVEQLGYAVPMMVRDKLSKHYQKPFKKLLDLGCGTGLSAEALDGMAAHKTGVDISEGMVEVAYDKEVYEDLYVSEAVAFLQQKEETRWDLIVATDVIPYMGDLAEFFTGVSDNLEKDGVFAFSSETLSSGTSETEAFKVGDFQRFAHSEDYIKRELKQNSFELLEMEPIIVRYEQGNPVPGHLVLCVNS